MLCQTVESFVSYIYSLLPWYVAPAAWGGAAGGAGASGFLARNFRLYHSDASGPAGAQSAHMFILRTVGHPARSVKQLQIALICEISPCNPKKVFWNESSSYEY